MTRIPVKKKRAVYDPTNPRASKMTGVVVPHLWKKGERPPGAGARKGESITALIRRVMEQKVRGIPIKEMVVDRLFHDALHKGDYKFLKELLDRSDGKVADRVVIARDDEFNKDDRFL